MFVSHTHTISKQYTINDEFLNIKDECNNSDR